MTKHTKLHTGTTKPPKGQRRVLNLTCLIVYYYDRHTPSTCLHAVYTDIYPYICVYFIFYCSVLYFPFPLSSTTKRSSHPFVVAKNNPTQIFTMASTNQSTLRTFIASSVVEEYDDNKQVFEVAASAKSDQDKATLLSTIYESVIGSTTLHKTPFGMRKLTYCDWTASGRGLSFFEDYLREEVIPLYANTHSSASATGLQSTLFRQEARSIVLRSVHGSKEDVVLFCGSGSTGAINTLCRVMGFFPDGRFRDVSDINDRPVVFTSAFEHHSNLLPWRESGCDVVTIGMDEARGQPIDIDELRSKLVEFTNRKTKIGSFSAASNVTGVLVSDSTTADIAYLLHEHGALSFWDYAASAPYVNINMNPHLDSGKRSMFAKDAVFISPHKFVGGISTPGVLVVKKSLLQNHVPSTPGGGTVFFVTDHGHTYLQNFEEREEGGTPDILGAIRCGLAFQLKENVGSQLIQKRESSMLQRALSRWTSNPAIVIAGHPKLARLPIVSFLVRAPLAVVAHQRDSSSAKWPAEYLHFNFVAALLNDLFGIQCRGGCMCAGPYAQHELGIDANTADCFESCLLAKSEIVRPGYVRLNLNYFIPDEECDRIVDAVDFVATHGWKFLPAYSFYADTGEWRHRSCMTKVLGRRWLGMISYRGGKMQYRPEQRTVEQEPRDEQEKHSLQQYLATANELVRRCVLNARKGDKLVEQSQFLSDSEKSLRWFVLPSEASWVMHTCASIDPLAEWSAWSAAAVGLDQHTNNNSMNADTEQKTEYAGIALSKPIEPRLYHTSDKQDAAKPELEANNGVLDGAEQIPLAAANNADEDSDSSDNDFQMLPGGFSDDDDDNDGANDNTAATGNGIIDSNGDAKSQASKAANASRGIRSSYDIASKAATMRLCKNCFHDHAGDGSGRNVPECVSCGCVSFVARQPANKKAIKRIERKLGALVGNAVRDFDMIREGDRVLVALSGGKDSLTMLHVLLEKARRSPVKFSIGAVTVDPQTPEYNPRALIPYLASLGVPYFYESQPILEQAKQHINPNSPSICAFCARMKRGVLYSTCRREGYNVLSMGQHLDDLAESFLMSAFHNGSLRTMKANYHVENGDIRIIRPLVYCRERLMREFANLTDLPVINENCPACFEAPKERARIKSVLAAQEHLFPTLFGSLLQCMQPLMARENRNLKHAPADGAPNSKALSNIRKDPLTHMPAAPVRSKATAQVSRTAAAAVTVAPDRVGTKTERYIGNGRQVLHNADVKADDPHLLNINTAIVYAGSLEQLHTIAATHRIVVVDCFARWCVPCKEVEPLFTALHKRYRFAAAFVKVDIDNVDDDFHSMDVSTIPTVVVFEEGKECTRLAGIHDIFGKLENVVTSKIAAAAAATTDTTEDTLRTEQME
jgi:selenocysteine lyase/cysteine desulfurase/tRNA(Ile)-lysidine synthase TilS/MesJ/thiol-disulfide isomerase/thioredoxin